MFGEFSRGATMLLLSWVAWIVVSVLLSLVIPWRSYLPAVLTDMLAYGKLKTEPRVHKSSPATSSPSFLRFFSIPRLMLALNSVPRRYFTHFYVWGSIWNFLLLTSILMPPIPVVGILVDLLTGSSTHEENEGQWSQRKVDVVLTLFLLLVQTLRRLFECLFVVEHSDRKMHAVHYVLGLYFYTAIGPTAILHLSGRGGPPFTVHWRHISAVVLFVWASYHQCVCHIILADLRKARTPRQQSRDEQNDNMVEHAYHRTRARDSCSKPRTVCSAQNLHVGLPVGDWFQFVSCPHYSAEVLIYWSLMLVEWGSTAMLLPCVFVVCVLSLSAHQMHGWYCSKFNDYPRNRKRIIPCLF